MSEFDGSYRPATDADALILRHLLGEDARCISVPEWAARVAPLLPLHNLTLELD